MRLGPAGGICKAQALTTWRDLRCRFGVDLLVSAFLDVLQWDSELVRERASSSSENS